MIHSTPPHLNGHIFAAVDVETTGGVAGFHEIIQIAVIPLKSDLSINDSVPPYEAFLRPEYPERSEAQALAVSGLSLDDLIVRGMSQERAAEDFTRWFESLDLPHDRRLVGIAHNYPMESSFIGAWLGNALYDSIFHFHHRCTMALALSLNDKAFFRGLPKLFDKVGLNDICTKLGVVNKHRHNATADSIACAEAYRLLLNLDVL